MHEGCAYRDTRADMKVNYTSIGYENGLARDTTVLYCCARYID